MTARVETESRGRKKRKKKEKPSDSRTASPHRHFPGEPHPSAFESANEDAIEGIARRLAMGAHLEQTKQSDLAAAAVLRDCDFLRVVQDILDDLGVLEGQRGSRADGGDSTILRLTANCACEKKQQNRRSGRERGRGSRPRSRANARRREGCTYHRIDFARVVRPRRARRLRVRLVAQRDITAPLRLGGPQRHHRAGVRPPPRARRAGRLPPRARPSRSRSTERRASSPAARLNLR